MYVLVSVIKCIGVFSKKYTCIKNTFDNLDMKCGEVEVVNEGKIE